MNKFLNFEQDSLNEYVKSVVFCFCGYQQTVFFSQFERHPDVTYHP